MYVQAGVPFLSSRVNEGFFRYYRFGLGYIHLNRYIILFSFKKFLRLIRLEPIVNTLKACYNLIGSTDSDNNVH
jgi:hypothetical protein